MKGSFTGADLTVFADIVRPLLTQEKSVSFAKIMKIAEARGFNDPAEFAVNLGIALEIHHGRPSSPEQYLKDLERKFVFVMERAAKLGASQRNETSLIEGDWGMKLKAGSSQLGVGGDAMCYAIATQEFNAGGGLVSAAPTGGASGTLPGVLIAMKDHLQASMDKVVNALAVAGLIGFVAFSRGPVSGAQAGCGAEIGVAAMMAAAAATYMLGGSWAEINAASSLAGATFVGLECSPAFGKVEYPCTPRNGHAALVAIASAEMAMAKIHPPYNIDQTLDRIFTAGRLLPLYARETEEGHWGQTMLEVIGHFHP